MARHASLRGRIPAAAAWLSMLVVGLVAVAAGSLNLFSGAGVGAEAPGSNAAGGARSSEVTRPAGHDPGSPSPAQPTQSPAPVPKSQSLIQPRPGTAPETIAAPETAPVSPIAEPPMAVPVAITLGGSETRIRVIPIGVSPTGTLEPPADPAVVGWWVAGPRPGTQGRAVITGHIDSPAGLGAFAALDELHPGDPLVVTDAAGAALHYVVTDRQQIEKTTLDPALLNRSGGSDLLLVTCIGQFDDSTLSYDSNLLITAVEDQPPLTG